MEMLLKTANVLNWTTIQAAIPKPTDKAKFWNFVNDDGSDTATLQLFGTIESEESWWSEDNVTYRQFIEELNALGNKKTIRVEINSGGGDVFAANAIYTALIMNKATIEGYILGLCASAATIILMACTVRKIAKNAILMAHNPKVTLYGSYGADDLLKLSEITDKVKESIKNAYKERLNKTDKELNDMMNTETWLVGQEAVDEGFCTDIIEEAEVTNFVNGDALTVNGILHTIRNDYVDSVIPDEVRKKVLAITNQSGTFLNIKHKKGNEDMGEKNLTQTQIENVEQLRAAYPELCRQLENSAIEGERNRIQEIDKVANHIPDEMLERAKYTDAMTAKDLCFAVMTASNNLGQAAMDNMVKDLDESGTKNVSTVPTAGTAQGAGDTSAEKAGRLANFMKKDRRRG